MDNSPPPRWYPRESVAPVEAWATQQLQSADARWQLPVLALAQRLALASQRLRELQAAVDIAQERVLNAPVWLDAKELVTREDRVLRLEQLMHDERRALLQDVRPLLSQASDAAIESFRWSWIRSLTEHPHRGGP